MNTDDDEYYEIKNPAEVQGDEQLPALVREWVETFGKVSRYNEFPATLAFFNLLGEIVKDYVWIPYGYTVEDTRIHVAHIQTSRSGKSVLNDFYSQICEKTFEYINAHSDETVFDMFDIVDYTDAALIGSTIKIPNPEFGEEGEPREIDTQVDGALEGSGIALFDEFEASGVFKKGAHKENVITYFQKLMNTLTTDGYKVKKKLAHGPIIVCDCQRAVWATTYPPEHLTEVIATKGVLQRMFMYVRDVPQHILDEMRKTLIHDIGKIKKRSVPQLKFAKAMLALFNIVQAKAEHTDKERMITFEENTQNLIEMEYDNMVRHLRNVPDEVRKIVSLFETNSLIYITKLAVLCAIAETPGRDESEKWIVFPRNVRQGAWIVRQGYMSMVAWMIVALKVRRTSVAEEAGLNEYVTAYHNMDKKDGWVNKAEFRIFCETTHKIPQARFYRNWDKLSNKFDKKKQGRTVFVKLKEENE
tara:strand:+ start:751 stop:2169 length:1419 start_codon:yes stop_codon:yes gene_type:complete